MHAKPRMAVARPGSRIGDYVIDAELSDRPGVFASTHRFLPRHAHIVMPSPERAVELACLLEVLRHPAVPRIYECGQLDDRPWLAVAIVDGVTLAERISNGPLSVVEVIALIRDLAAILTHAHATGIVHGDVCVDHVAYGRAGWQLVDWSEASRAGDHETDTQALGAVAYAALARALPTLPIARRCPGVPVALARLIDDLLAGAMPADAAHSLASRLVEDLAQPAWEDDVLPISVEDIVLLDVRRPPPVPVRLRVRAQGTGPVPVGRIALEKKES